MQGASISDDGSPPVTCERLYVSNIPRHVAESDLQALFAPFGQLKEVQIHRRSDGTPKGTAFVAFMTFAEASAACYAVNNFLMPGATRPLSVKPSTSRKPSRGQSHPVESAAGGASQHAPEFEAAPEYPVSCGCGMMPSTGGTHAEPPSGGAGAGIPPHGDMAEIPPIAPTKDDGESMKDPP